MPVSDSKFDESGVTLLPWCRVFALALSLFVCSVRALEAYWRGRGGLPDVPDTVDLWRFWRTRIYDPQGGVVVFLGTSRIRGDIDLDVLRRNYPAYRFVQLGIIGNASPIGTLRSLSLDTGFRGIVICEFAAPFLERSRWEDQRTYFHEPLSNKSLDGLIYAYLRDHAVVLNPRFGIARLCRYVVIDKGLPSPSRCRGSF